MPSGIGTAGAGAELTSEQAARILVNPLQAAPSHFHGSGAAALT